MPIRSQCVEAPPRPRRPGEDALTVIKTPQLALVALAAAAGLAGCAQLDTRANVGPCPVSGALFETSRMFELEGEELHENVGFTGEILGVRGFCRYVGDSPITMELDIDFALGRGPKADGDRHVYQYFVAITRRDRVVLAKETFSFEARFPRGAREVRVTRRLEDIVIPRATETVSGRNFEVIVGFELTPEQLAFNRSGKRFTMKVE
jgi:hypothetical protein